MQIFYICCTEKTVFDSFTCKVTSIHLESPTVGSLKISVRDGNVTVKDRTEHFWSPCTCPLCGLKSVRPCTWNRAYRHQWTCQEGKHDHILAMSVRKNTNPPPLRMGPCPKYLIISWKYRKSNMHLKYLTSWQGGEFVPPKYTSLGMFVILAWLILRNSRSGRTYENQVEVTFGKDIYIVREISGKDASRRYTRPVFTISGEGGDLNLHDDLTLVHCAFPSHLPSLTLHPYHVFFCL